MTRSQLVRAIKNADRDLDASIYFDMLVSGDYEPEPVRAVEPPPPPEPPVVYTRACDVCGKVYDGDHHFEWIKHQLRRLYCCCRDCEETVKTWNLYEHLEYLKNCLDGDREKYSGRPDDKQATAIWLNLKAHLEGEIARYEELISKRLNKGDK